MRTRELVVRTAEWCGVLVLVVAALPLVALAGFIARGLAVVVLVLSLAAALVGGLHPALRSRMCQALGLRGTADPAARPLVRRQS